MYLKNMDAMTYLSEILKVKKSVKQKRLNVLTFDLYIFIKKNTFKVKQIFKINLVF